MSQGEVKKCSYFNSGYCRYTKKDNGCKNFHPIDECKIQGCKQKECPGRHPKKCKFNDECRFRTICSYSHAEKSIVNEDQIKLSNDILILKTEISNLKKENDQKINVLAKVHLQELDYLKQKNNVLTKNVEELEKRLASQDIDLSNAQNILKITSEKKSTPKCETKETKSFPPTPNKSIIESENNSITKLKLIKYKCDHCMFEAKSMRGIKTHTGHMHKDLKETVESTHAIQIYKCTLCDYFYNNKEELERHEEEH